jgi:release factor glutamine methyltransferase
MSVNAVDRACARLLTEKYAGESSAAYQADCERVRAGEPYEYVLGWVDFLGARIDLSHRPMIPRPETAFWVERAITEFQSKPGPLRIADTFSGAGNVGLAILKHLPEARVEFFELDPGLMAQIEKNLALNQIDPSRFLVTAASDIQGLSGEYDAIFAVPPYVPYDALPDLDPEMIRYEPHLAFFAEDDGHAFHKLLVGEARRFLKPDGVLFMEADYDDGDFIRSIVTSAPWSELEFWPDPYGATPNVVLRA